MGSRNPPGSYDEAILLALDQAFIDIWAVLKAHDPFHDWKKDSELRTALAEKLMALVAVGVTNPNELRRLALDSLPLRQGATIETS